MDSEKLLVDQPRWLEVALGIATGAIAVALFSLNAYFLWLVFGRTPSMPALVLLGCIALVGVFFLALSRRLLLGKGRNDGGLFPPFALRLAGVIFLSSPLLLFFGPRTHFLNVILCIGAGVACFTLASRRSDS